MKTRSLIIELTAYSLIILFVYTAVSKWADFGQFVKQMDAQPFNDALTPLLVWGLPIIELLTAGLLLFNKTRIFGLYASLLLMVAFTIYIALIRMNYYGYRPCACGGIIRAFTWEKHFIFNLYFVLIAALGIFLYHFKARPLKNTAAATP